MIEKIENLDVLKYRLESSYETYSQHGNSDTLSYWKNYLAQNPDQIDFCVNVLLNKEKEKQLAVLGKREMHRSNSEPFLRDTSRNLTAEILLHLISNVEDKEYFEARKKHAEVIQAKLTGLRFSHDDFSDDELLDPKVIVNQQARERVEELNKFLATLPHPILQSKRLPILLKHLSGIDLTDINWVDKIFNLLSISDSNKGNPRNGIELKAQRFLKPNKITEESIKKNLTLLVEYQKLKTRYPENDEAEKRFARFFLWHCKKEDLAPKAAAARYHSFLHQHGLYAAFTNYLDVVTQYPPIKIGMYSTDFCAKTEDSATVIAHQTLPFGEDMTQDEKNNLLLNLNVTCCFANQSGVKIRTTGTDQAFFVRRNKGNLGNIEVSAIKGDPAIEGRIISADYSDQREIFVILVSGDAPTSTEEMKELLTKYPLSTQKLSEKLAGEISTENGKAPITISILPIDRNSKKLHYAAHIPGESLERAKEFKQRLEALSDFDNYKKLKEEVEQLIQKTEHYFAKLNDEIESEKESFLASHLNSTVTYNYEAWGTNETRVPTEMNISNVNDQDNAIFNNTIGEKAKLRFEVSQSLKKLKSNDKTALEKIQEFSENLFTVEAAAEPLAAAQPAVAKPSLAKRIENTKTGFDYLKDIISIIASGVAFASVVGIIPMIAYRYKAHKWLWESNRGNFLDEAQKAKEMQETTFPRAPVAAA